MRAQGAPDAFEGPSGEVCLITGATGFIGAHLARRLVQEGHPVRCLVRPGSDTSALTEMGAELLVGDLADAAPLDGAAAGCRYVFHCGALVSDWATKGEMFATNVAGTRRLLAAAADGHVERVIHLSTTDVYGYPGGRDIDETFTSRRFRNWYSQTKREAEDVVRRFETTAGIDAVVLRPATVYGPGSTSVVGEIARAICAGNMLLIGGGRAVAGLCYVENLVDVALLAARHPAAGGEAFNVTDGLDTSWREFTDLLADGLGCRRVRWSLPYPLALGLGVILEEGYRLQKGVTGWDSPALLSRQAVHVLGLDQDFSSRKARELLGWEPRVDMEEGLEATLDWLRGEHLVRA